MAFGPIRRGRGRWNRRAHGAKFRGKSFRNGQGRWANVNIYLVRHGAALAKEVDPDRPLAPEGRDAASRVARALKGSGATAVGGIHHSTKLRARQTAEILGEALGLEELVTEVPNLEPLDDVAELASALEKAGNDLMLVGHLPHLNRLASRLVAGDAAVSAFDFPECGVLCLGRKGEEESGGGGWTVRWMLDPAVLGF